MNIETKIILGFVFSLVSSIATAYEDATHRELTKIAVSKSVIYTDPAFMSKLGLASLGTQVLPVFKQSTSPDQWMLAQDAPGWGAYWEDNIVWFFSFRHFFDPQWNNGVGRALSVAGAPVPSAVPSPDWALEDKQSYIDQGFSFNKAQGYLFRALSGVSPTERETAMGMVFQSLGHVVHHIQDMAQPQHVRNERHIHFPVTDSLSFTTAAAAYEEATKENWTVISGMLPAYQYVIPKFSSVRQYWTGAAGGYSSMADFTAKNYVSMETGYRYENLGLGQWQLKNDPDFPLPNGFNKDGSAKTVAQEQVSVYSWKQNRKISAPGYFVKGSVYDGLNAGQTTANQYLGYQSALDQLGNGGGVRIFHGFQEKIWQDEYKILLPRAISFSAGVINHFFRGQANIVSAGGNNWNLVNEGQDTSSGVFYVYSEVNGQRSLLSSFQLNIAPGASSPIVLAVPDAASKLIVVFQGMVGAENNRVHGRVVTLAKATTSSSLTVSASQLNVGSSLSLSATVAGNTPTGSVQFKQNGVAIGSPIKLSAAGAAAYAVGALPEGVYSFSVDFLGDARNAPSSSAAINVSWIYPCRQISFEVLPSPNNTYSIVEEIDLGTLPGRVYVEASGVMSGGTLQISRKGDFFYGSKISWSGPFEARRDWFGYGGETSFGGRIIKVRWYKPMVWGGSGAYNVFCPQN